LLLGDNPFIGVSHFSQDKAREELQEARLGNKISVFEAAVDGGATGFTFSTHESNLELLTYLSVNRKDLLRAMNYYILVPYAQSYVRKANLGGTPMLLRSTLRGMVRDWSDISDMMHAVALLKMNRLAGLFLKSEIAPFLDVLPKENVKAILLHEILTDAAMAFGLFDLIESIGRYVKERIGLKFGLHTKNLGCLYERKLLTCDSFEYLMTPINPLGYGMAPCKETAEEAVKNLGGKINIIAINVLASGAVDLETTIAYMRRFKEDIWAVTSASTKPHRIRENFEKFRLSLGAAL